MSLYSDLQGLLRKNRKGRLELLDGDIEFTDEDLEFIGFNNTCCCNPDLLVSSISLFTEDGDFFDNIPVRIKLSDETPWMGFVKDYKLYLTLPRSDFVYYDPDVDIIHKIIEPFGLKPHYEDIIVSEFRGAIAEYFNGQQDTPGIALGIIDDFADDMFVNRNEDSLELFKRHVELAMRICISSIKIKEKRTV